MCFWGLVGTECFTMGHQVIISETSQYEVGIVRLIKSKWTSPSAIHYRMEMIHLECRLGRDIGVSNLCEQYLRLLCYPSHLHPSPSLSSHLWPHDLNMTRWRRRERPKLGFWMDWLDIWVQIQNGWQLHSSHTQGCSCNTMCRELQEVYLIILL